ncbi:MAG: hypothetical protein AYP45_11375 [Candidatus Brocadia carolinensis]|uniref:Uncharacterized protein n=1 Tax=Candidatus Brocadia carolinensis TaxID=1004156 RepID=A0A1V4ASI1_9BACT|nr:MAG: hypothetical protein AYP45_11375 [Candidatus Brocadia caroliniensis]
MFTLSNANALAMISTICHQSIACVIARVFSEAISRFYNGEFGCGVAALWRCIVIINEMIHTFLKNIPWGNRYPFSCHGKFFS